MFKDILVPIPGRRGNMDALNVGAFLADSESATLVVYESGRRSISSILLEHARLAMAELLVAGAHGHSRPRESVLGGVTRKLLISASIPVFYSH